jgi:hypothetical protein
VGEHRQRRRGQAPAGGGSGDLWYGMARATSGRGGAAEQRHVAALAISGKGRQRRCGLAPEGGGTPGDLWQRVARLSSLRQGRRG